MVSERHVLPVMFLLAFAVVVAAINQSLGWHPAQGIANSGGQVFNEKGQSYLCDSVEEPTSTSNVDSPLSHPIQQFTRNLTDTESIDSDGNGWPDVGVKALSWEELNLSTLPGTTAECTAGGQGDCDNIKDDDESTYYQKGCRNDYGPVCMFSYEAAVNFNEVVGNLRKVEFVSQVGGAGGSNNTIYLYYDGDWHEVYKIALGAGYPYFDSGKVTHSTEGSWSNVEKVKLVVNGFGVYDSSIMTATFGHSLYELRTFGTLLPPDVPPQSPAGDVFHPISQIRRGVSGAENQKIDSDGNGWPDKCDIILDIPGTVHYWIMTESFMAGVGQCPSMPNNCNDYEGEVCDTPGITVPCGPCQIQGGPPYPCFCGRLTCT